MISKREAAIITIYTMHLLGDLSYAEKYAEELMGRPVYTHELGDDKFTKLLKRKAKKDFEALIENIET